MAMHFPKTAYIQHFVNQNGRFGGFIVRDSLESAAEADLGQGEPGARVAEYRMIRLLRLELRKEVVVHSQDADSV